MEKGLKDQSHVKTITTQMYQIVPQQTKLRMRDFEGKDSLNAIYRLLDKEVKQIEDCERSFMDTKFNRQRNNGNKTARQKRLARTVQQQTKATVK